MRCKEGRLLYPGVGIPNVLNRNGSSLVLASVLSVPVKNAAQHVDVLTLSRRIVLFWRVDALSRGH